MKYHIKTFGCQMNHSDSERIAGFLESRGLTPILTKGKADLSAEALAKADLVIFNTCGVRQMAEDRVYGQIHNLKKAHPEVKIILTGCLANRKDVQRRLKDKVDIFCEIKDLFKIQNSKFKIQNSDDVNSTYLKTIPKYESKHTSYVPIMTGCNNFCSYCVVPYARGREVSRPADEIIAEVKNLVKNGCKEIVLLGQNVNSYNFEFPISNLESNNNDLILKHSKLNQNSKFKIQNFNTVNFPLLLGAINAIPGTFWISFISNHPKDFSDELIETMTKCKKVCEYVHLPVQAGDDKVLKNMNRKYTAEEYLKLVGKVKKAFRKNKPGKLFSITSDIIVGFPGETKKQFLESAKVMEEVGYDMVYFGQFSPRPGTAAWKMKDNVSKAEKQKRENYLNEILKKTTSENNKKYVGKALDVLIDKNEAVRRSTSDRPGSLDVERLKGQISYFGRTRTMKNVKVISKKKNLVGKIVKVNITKANIWNLEGELL